MLTRCKLSKSRDQKHPVSSEQIKPSRVQGIINSYAEKSGWSGPLLSRVSSSSARESDEHKAIRSRSMGGASGVEGGTTNGHDVAGPSVSMGSEEFMVLGGQLRTQGSHKGSHKVVMVVVDNSRESRLAMLWALSHLIHRRDTLSLLHVASPASTSSTTTTQAPPPASLSSLIGAQPSNLVLSLRKLCLSRRPEVDVEVMTVEGNDKGPIIVSQAKKLQASILVLGHRKSSLFQRLFHIKVGPNNGDKNRNVVDYCIENADCLTLAVRKKGKQMGGYLISSQCQKDFWLLA